MIVSVNWLKKYTAINDVPQLIERIGARLVEIEEVKSLKEKYAASKATIAKVIDCVDHPDSDHLHICKIDDGGVNDVLRDENGYVQVVCGAPNIRAGLTVVWLPPTAVVPESYGTDDEFVLSARKLRGVLSQGMIASPRELDLWNEHEGIMEINDPTAQPGMSLGELLNLEDYLLEVENKSLTHRPDCFGMIGFAREVAAILGQTVQTPEWFNNLDGAAAVDSNELQPTVTIADPDLCARYECVALDNVDSSRELPLAMRSLIARSGANSIDAPVDITNYLMFETGQPLHAFDLDKVMEVSPTGRADIVVRAGAKGETLELLDGKVVELDPADIVIAAGDTTNSVPIALAGAMGGMETEITKATKRVLLESATFDLYHLRSTQFRHGVFSEAITRFTKGQPAGLTHPVLLQAVEMLRQYAGARVVSGIAADGKAPDNLPQFKIVVDKFTSVLGLYEGRGYSADLITTTLCNLQYTDVRADGGYIYATAPWWRTDLHIDEDVIEDIGRVNGYDNIASSSPSRHFVAAPYDQLYQKQMWLRERLKEAGGNEVVTYSFVHGNLLDRVGDDKSQAFRIVNAISPNLQYYRRDLLPGLVELVRDNLRAGYDNFLLFELGKVHRQGQMDSGEPTLPAELPEVAGVVVGKNKRADSAYYTVKKVVEYALAIDTAELEFVRLDRYASELDSSTKLFEPTRSAVLLLNGRYVGVVGEFTAVVRRNFKLPDFVAGFTLLTAELLPHLDDGSVYTPVLRYQGTSRDITYQVDDDKTYQQVLDFTRRVLNAKLEDGMVVAVAPRDIYDAGDGRKNVTLHIDFHDRNQTINAKLVGKMMDRLAKQAQNELGAKVI